MSLVKYNTLDSLEFPDSSNEMMVVYKNNQSGEVVLYNNNSNDFEIVKLNHSFSASIPIDDTQSDTNGDFGQQGKRRRSSTRQTSGFVCRVCGAFNDFVPENDDDLMNQESHNLALAHPNNYPYDFTTTSSGNLIRGDYFKLLRNSMFRNVKTEPLLTDGDSDVIKEHVELNSISEQIINQGYFDKFFKIISKLGSGSYGSVYKVEHELLGLNLGVFALKKIPIGDDVNNLKKILNEVKFLYDLSCNITENNHNNNNIVKYNHVWIEIDQVSRFSPKIPVVFLLFEYCAGGTLEDFVESIREPKFNIIEEKLLRRKKIKRSKKARLLNNYEIFKIFNDITKGLNYLHGLKILHRDLKPSNCLFKTKFDPVYQPISTIDELEQIPTLLVSDFGESIMVSSIEEKWQNNLQSTGTTGTLEFCAPEIIKTRKAIGKSGTFSYSSDVYSLGMILYYLCFGKLPFSNNASDPEDISEQILSTELFENLYELRTTGSGGILVDWIVLIDALVASDPTTRPDTDQILHILDEIRMKLETQCGATNHTINEKLVDDELELDHMDEIESKNEDALAHLEEADDLCSISQTGHITMLMMFSVNFFFAYWFGTGALLNTQFFVIGIYFGDYKPILKVVYLEIILTALTLFYCLYKLF